MRNLAKCVFETYFPDMINNVDLENPKPVQNDVKQSRLVRHDPTQRKGKMSAPHVRKSCEACQLGFCYA